MEITTSNSIKEVAHLLMEQDDIMILTHIRPDGDTLGCAFALKEALEQKGKRTFVANSMEITPKYAFLAGGVTRLERPFEPKFIVSVDIAAPDLFGQTYEGITVDLVLDHHKSNKYFGRLLNVVAVEFAACGELIYQLILELKTTLTEKIAKALYTAVSTDTGCFKFSNTTANTHMVAAKLMEVCSMEQLNRELFLTKTKTQLQVEAEAYQNLEFYENGAVAVICITTEMCTRLQATEDDVDGMSNLPRSIEGVMVGITIKQQAAEEYKISMRTNGKADASHICARFSGGGHMRAAGCTIFGTLAKVKEQIVSASIEEYRTV